MHWLYLKLYIFTYESPWQLKLNGDIIFISADAIERVFLVCKIFDGLVVIDDITNHKYLIRDIASVI